MSFVWGDAVGVSLWSLEDGVVEAAFLLGSVEP